MYTHTHTLALLCLQSKQSVTGECVSLLFVCSSLCAPWCLPLQNNGLAWENLSTGGLILPVCVHVFFLDNKHCNSDCTWPPWCTEYSYFALHQLPLCHEPQTLKNGNMSIHSAGLGHLQKTLSPHCVLIHRCSDNFLCRHVGTGTRVRYPIPGQSNYFLTPEKLRTCGLCGNTSNNIPMKKLQCLYCLYQWNVFFLNLAVNTVLYLPCWSISVMFNMLATQLRGNLNLLNSKISFKIQHLLFCVRKWSAIFCTLMFPVCLYSPAASPCQSFHKGTDSALYTISSGI